MNTFQLSCFLTVAETLNFARAAKQLNVTQPAVTHQIRSLETELGVKLFKRSTRSVELTREGSIFINDAKSMIAISLRAKKRFESPSDHEIQVFSIGCHSYSQLFLLPDILRQMAQIHPSLHPRLQVVPFQHLYRLLEEEDVDVIVGFQESDEKKVPGIYRELMKVPIICVCSDTHPFASRPSIRPSDLEHERLVLNDPMKSPASVAKLQGLLMGGRAPADFYFCDSSEAATVLVQSGFGVCVLPDLYIPPDSRLLHIPMEGMDPLSFGVYYKSLKESPILRDFIRIAKTFAQQFLLPHDR